jgi:hypothetical protein
MLRRALADEFGTIRTHRWIDLRLRTGGSAGHSGDHEHHTTHDLREVSGHSALKDSTLAIGERTATAMQHKASQLRPSRR